MTDTLPSKRAPFCAVSSFRAPENLAKTPVTLPLFTSTVSTFPETLAMYDVTNFWVGAALLKSRSERSVTRRRLATLLRRLLSMFVELEVRNSVRDQLNLV